MLSCSAIYSTEEVRQEVQDPVRKIKCWELYLRHVDDITKAYKAVDLGVRLKKEEMMMEKIVSL